jgi:hypothetical protein
MATSLLDKDTLDQMRETLYGDASLTFYRITPANAEEELLTLTEGFFPQRLTRNADTSEGAPQQARILVAASVLDDPSLIHTGAVVTLTVTVDEVESSWRMRVQSFNPVQQFGAGYELILGQMKITGA